MITMASLNGLKFIKSFEGCRLTAYQEQAGVWTIGYGTTRYKNGDKVKQGDVITQQQADDMLAWEVSLKAAAVAGEQIHFNQNQFDAAVSFAYNVGITAFSKQATWVKLARVNPINPDIRYYWMQWNKVAGIVNDGIVRRRKAEVYLYFS